MTRNNSSSTASMTFRTGPYPSVSIPYFLRAVLAVRVVLGILRPQYWRLPELASMRVRDILLAVRDTGKLRDTGTTFDVCCTLSHARCLDSQITRRRHHNQQPTATTTGLSTTGLSTRQQTTTLTRSQATTDDRTATPTTT